jgi:glutamyl-tRNA synthetase
LGWGHGDDEIFSDAQAIAWFDVTDVVRAPARLDWAKLNHINNHYLRLADDARLAQLTLTALRGRGAELPADVVPRLEAVIPMVKEGAKTILELADLTIFALKVRPLVLDGKAQQILNDENARDRLIRLTDRLASAKLWSPPSLEADLKDFAASEGVGLGKIGPGLRGILSGGSPAPDLAGAMAALGQDETVGRLKDALFNPTKTL